VRLAFLFPGQGAQSVGMGKALADAFPEARTVFEAADKALGLALSEICWNGPEERLRETRHAQPALLTHSVAALRLLEKHGIEPTWCAGHSLGEYSACVAAGALGFDDAVRLVYRRGELMHQAGIDRPGTMAAVLGLSREEVEAACAEASAMGTVVAANFNAPGQIVISGEVAAVEKAGEAAKARGAKRVIPLVVSGAFHSPLMASAAQGLHEKLSATRFSDARCAIIANVSAAPVARADDVRSALDRQLLGAVRWEDSMRTLLDAHAEGFVEIGAGKVLRGLLRTVSKDAASWNVEDPESLQATLVALGAVPATEGSGRA
jgi:[acyl-carrier-protein] S-malonyltransferase